MEYRFLEDEHLHQLNKDGEWKNLTGTSSVGDVLAKNLTWWAAELAAVECLEVGEKIPTIRAEYLEAVGSADKKAAIDALQKKYPLFKTARYAHNQKKKDAASKGTDLHQTLEDFVRYKMGKIPPPAEGFDTRITPFIEWADENVEKYKWAEAHCYSKRLFVGGISDCGVVLENGTLAIIDFKSAKEAYANHFLQCAGYAIEVEENGLWDITGTHNKKLELEQKVDALIIVPFGASKVVPVIKTNVDDYKRGFEAAVTLYRLMN